MKNSLFFIPTLYFYLTRLKSLTLLLNWVFIYILPTLVLFFTMSEDCSLEYLLLKYILVLFAVYTVYEVGYIQNDTETIKYEKNPTLRLSDEQLHYYESHKKLIYFVRYFSTLVIIALLSLFSDISFQQIQLVIIALTMMSLTFYFYNLVRNNFTLLLLFILVVLRYITPLLLVYTQLFSFYFIAIILLYPLLNLLDWTYKPRFKQFLLSINQASLRVWYYVLLSSIFTYMYFATSQNQYLVSTLLAIYFLLYRTIFIYAKKRVKR